MRALVFPPAKALNFTIPGEQMKTNEDLASELLQKAESGKHRRFQLIRNWQEYSYTRKLRQTHLLLVSSIRKSADSLFKQHCKNIITGQSDVTKLVAYCATINVLRFYEEELNTIEEMIIEYECYLAAGNWLDFIFCSQRPFDKLWDHRGE